MSTQEPQQFAKYRSPSPLPLCFSSCLPLHFSVGGLYSLLPKIISLHVMKKVAN